MLPAREACPRCLGRSLTWQQASGKARLISWIVYHQAFHPSFAQRLPYTVAIVELEEGARMVSNIVGTEDPESLRIDMPLTAIIEQQGDVRVPRFGIAR
jgi:uncharacterized OB-fold protein